MVLLLNDTVTLYSVLVMIMVFTLFVQLRASAFVVVFNQLIHL